MHESKAAFSIYPGKAKYFRWNGG